MSLALVLPIGESLKPGEVVGAYVIEQLLGEGTMGRVYLARHQRLGRQVAMKVLHQRLLSDRQLVQRFLQEGRLVNQINHQHIVEVYDFVEELVPERVFCVMELLRGETLAQRIEREPLPLARVIEIATQVCRALGAAHAAGVVHRDLKPDNIFLVTRDGRETVKVLDFGLAKLALTEGQVSAVESQQGVLLGTPRYMAPEQAAGLPADERTDIYALGTILYEMLTGRVPFESTSFGQLAADLITRPPPPLGRTSQSGEVIPVGLARLVAECLAKRAEQRPASMRAVEDALATGLHPKRSRSPLVAPAVFVAVSALAAGAVFLLRPAPPAPMVEARPVAAVAPPPVAAPMPAAPAQVVVKLATQPQGAKVTRTDTGEVLGQTPFDLTLSSGATPVPLRFELEAHEPLERAVVPDLSQRLELNLKRVVRPRAQRPVTDGVLDPY